MSYDSHEAFRRWAGRRIPENAGRLTGWGSGNTGKPSPSGQYQWSDRGYNSYPEPLVPVATGYQTGSGVTYSMGGQTLRNPDGTQFISVGGVPLMTAINQGLANMNSTQVQLLTQAASNFVGWDARKNLQSTLGPTWEYAVQRAASEGVDPFEVVSWMARGGLGARLTGSPSFGTNPFANVDISGSSSSSSYGGGYGGGGGGGGGTTTVVTTNITSPDSARRLVNQALTGYLGREATGEERRRFLEALNEAERDNPTVQTISMDGNTQSQVVEQGLDVGAFTERYAQSRPDYAEFRAATDLMDTFLGVLEGPVS